MVVNQIVIPNLKHQKKLPTQIKLATFLGTVKDKHQNLQIKKHFLKEFLSEGKSKPFKFSLLIKF